MILIRPSGKNGCGTLIPPAGYSAAKLPDADTYLPDADIYPPAALLILLFFTSKVNSVFMCILHKKRYSLLCSFNNKT